MGNNNQQSIHNSQHNTSHEYEEVKKFHKAFNHPVSNTPTPISKERNYVRSKWILEEVIETVFALSDSPDDFLSQIEKMKQDLNVVAQETLGKNEDVELPLTNFEKIVGLADGLVDANYFINGSFAEAGVNPRALFDIVQNANMSKLDKDGNPIIRESDGKIMKPENWEAPEPKIRKEIQHQVSANVQ